MVLMSKTATNIGMIYDDGAYVEVTRQKKTASPGGPAGLMGRQVAGKQFLDAYLTHGHWTELVALIRDEANKQSLTSYCQSHPSSKQHQRRLRFFEEQNFQHDFFPDPPTRLLYAPCPPDARYAWSRQHGGAAAFALCGVTHTLCSQRAVEALCELVVAPFEPFDSLICTSQAVVDMVRVVTDTYCDYLRDRFGGAPTLRPQLHLIPLGVNPDLYCPPSPDERREQRHQFGIADDEIAVLFVGRLAHHAKAHPFPMFAGLSQATRKSGKKVCLILSGWTANDAVRQAFAAGARVFAPNVRTVLVEGAKAENRMRVWQAADVFTSLSDNIQETFGLVIIEAMACGLPVVATDWNGYRDLVVDGETGFLVPTAMVDGATASVTARLLNRELSYDHFLAECSQATAVDVSATAAAYERLLSDESLRCALGAAGRQRVLERFTWGHVVGAYERLWRQQESDRQKYAAEMTSQERSPVPAAYPAPEVTFRGYPSSWLNEDDRLQVAPNWSNQLDTLLSMPLTGYASEHRIVDAKRIRTVVSAAESPRTVAELVRLLNPESENSESAKATLAWLVKYNLLRRVDQDA